METAGNRPAIEVLIRESGLADVWGRVRSGDRLSREDGLRLYGADNLPAVGFMANVARERLNGNVAYYVRNQHINYTNVCNKLCKFCSFYVPPRDDRGYVLTPDDIKARLLQHIDLPITEIHMVAGINPKLPYRYYLDILDAVRAVRPDVHVKAFTMIELAQIQRVARKPMGEVLAELMAHGLSSLPGGGAEVFSERVREDLFWTKADSEQWLEIARTAHLAGLRSNATMLYGHVENLDEKVDHLVRLRELQDETGGFLTYIPLSFHPERTDIEHLPGPTGGSDLREIAVGRLMLDNFPHIKTFWIMNTIEVSQAALWYGADDIDGTIMEYEITRRTVEATQQVITRSDLVVRIVEAGRDPVERDNLYNVVSLEREIASETGGDAP